MKRTPYYRSCQFFTQWASMLMFRIRAYGQHHIPAEGGAILVCNHQSFMDPILAATALDRMCTFMARDTLFKNPLFKRLIESLNAFPVRRGEADIGAIKESLRRLKKGWLLVMFPEGTRSVDGTIGPMLPGLDAIARKARVPIIPTLIDGVFQAWPRTRPVPRPGNVIIQYDRPITPEDLATMRSDELTALLRSRLVGLQLEWHGRVPERRLK